MLKCTLRITAVLWAFMSAISSPNAMAAGWMNLTSKITCQTVDCSKPEIVVASLKRLIGAAIEIAVRMPDGAPYKLDIIERVSQCSEGVEALQDKIAGYANGTYVSRAAMLDDFGGTFQGQSMGCGFLVATLKEAGAR